MTKLVLVFKKLENEDKGNYDNFYSSLKVGTIINESDIDEVFQSIYTTIITNIQKSLEKGSGWMIDSVIDCTISISKDNPVAGHSYIKLLKEFDQSRKGLINIKNTDDNECFKWCLVRYLNPLDHNPGKLTKVYKDFAHRLTFKYIKFTVKRRREHHKIGEKNSIGISVFGYDNKQKYRVFVSKKYCE